MNKLEGNIWKLTFANLFAGFVFYYALDKVFMQSRGLSVTDLVLVEIVYVVFVVLLEVPSGALADRWSRKKVLALNMAFFILNTFLWVVGYNVTIFILGAIAGSIHSALHSGTETSLLYDTLTQLKKEKIYEKVLGNILFWNNGGAIVAGIFGSMLADYFGLVVPFWLTLITSLVALLIYLSLKDPIIHKTTGEINYWKHIAQTFHFLRKHPTLYHIIILSALLGATLGIMGEYMQLYFVGIGVPIFFLGYLNAAGNAIEGIGGKFAYLLSRFQRKNIYLILVLISATGFLFTGYFNSPIGIIFVFFPFVAQYFSVPPISTDLHKEFDSSHRATSESFANLFRMAIAIPLLLLFGYLADTASLFIAYSIIGMILAFYFVYFLTSSYRKII